MKMIDLEKSPIEELKAAAFDNLRQIDNLRKQAEMLNNAITQREQRPPEEKVEPKNGGSKDAPKPKDK